MYHPEDLTLVMKHNRILQTSIISKLQFQFPQNDSSAFILTLSKLAQLERASNDNNFFQHRFKPSLMN